MSYDFVNELKLRFDIYKGEHTLLIMIMVLIFCKQKRSVIMRVTNTVILCTNNALTLLTL